MPMDRVCIGHSADTTVIEYLEELLAAGVYLSLDRYPGRRGRPTWRHRNATVLTLVERGWGHRLMLGHDGVTQMVPAGEEDLPHEDDGPNGWTFLSTTAIPALLEAGLPRDTVDLITREVPRRFPHRGAQRLAVIYREVGYTVDRRVAAEGGVAAVMIVEMQPAGKRGGAAASLR